MGLEWLENNCSYVVCPLQKHHSEEQKNKLMAMNVIYGYFITHLDEIRQLYTFKRISCKQIF